MTKGRVRRAWLGIAGKTIPLPPKVAAKVGSPTGMRRWPRLSTAAPPNAPASTPETVMVELDGTSIVTATAVQKLMVEDAIDRRIEITVWRNGALVDVILRPRELTSS